MTKLFVFYDNAEYSEGEGTFYIPAATKNDAINAYKKYISSEKWWGKGLVPKEQYKIDREFKKKNERC